MPENRIWISANEWKKLENKNEPYCFHNDVVSGMGEERSIKFVHALLRTELYGIIHCST